MNACLKTSIALLFLLFSVTAQSFAAERKAVFAGGCFWGVEAVFEHVVGVTSVRSGYSGGTSKDANYYAVGTGRTGHAEAVEIIFDDTKVTYEQLLYIFFAVAYDPTEVDRQGPDTGPQYRSAIFYVDDDQKASAEAFVRSIETSKAFADPVATKLVNFAAFYPAEDEHQDFLRLNPANPYIVQHDLPKLAELKKKFPTLWIDRYGIAKKL
jgi:peptide-methionine (S)-S-oxide reductase